MEELKLLLETSSLEKGYMVSSLYKKTYDKRALSMMKPLLITETLLPAYAPSSGLIGTKKNDSLV